MKTRTKRPGMANIWFVLTVLLVMGFVSFAVDIGYVVLANQQLQNAADAAALAGAQQLIVSTAAAQQAAFSVALANSAAGRPVRLSANGDNLAGGDVVIGQYDLQANLFTPTLQGPDAVKVVARRTAGSPDGRVPLFFGPVLGFSHMSIQRSAIAMVLGGTGAGLITLNETDPNTFDLRGNVTLDVRDISDPDGGAIQVNSNNIDALNTSGNPTLLAAELKVVATSVSDPPDFDGDLRTNRPILPDPLAGLQPPTDWGADQGTVPGVGTHALEPGYYPEGITRHGGSLTLSPGIYVLDGDGLRINGGDFIAPGVMLYIVGGSVDLGGNGIIDITPVEIEPYTGMAIWQARDNTTDASFVGTGQFTGIEGTLYFPDAHVDITGTSDTFLIKQLICDTIQLTGNGTILISYDGQNTGLGNHVFLVE